MKHVVIFIIFIIESINLYPSTNHSPLCMSNEDVFLSFVIKNNKIISLCSAKDQSYIVYRYGTKNKIELEYPIDKNDSWLKFEYTYYTRQEDVKITFFTLDTSLHMFRVFSTPIIFEEYSSILDKTICGIDIINPQKKFTRIEGDIKSTIGSLYDFRFNDKIKKKDF